MYSILKKAFYLLIKIKNKKFLENLIRDGLQLGENVTIMQGGFIDPSHCFLISIGDNTTIAPNVRLIAHDASTKRNTGYTKIGKIQIGCDCFIGDSTIVLPNVRIGDRTIIGAGSVVVADIPSDCVAGGNPCKKILSAKEYLKKTETTIISRITPFAESQHNNLNSLQRQEILTFLNKGAGYIR